MTGSQIDMACPAGGHARCGGPGAPPLQSARRVSGRVALSVDPLAPQVTLEQPGFLSTMPAPGGSWCSICGGLRLVIRANSPCRLRAAA